MHEFSVALEVCRIVEDQVGRSELPHVLEVGVEIGVNSGLESASLAFCLEALLAQPPFRLAKAELLSVPGDVLRVQYLEIDDGDPAN